MAKNKEIKGIKNKLPLIVLDSTVLLPETVITLDIQSSYYKNAVNVSDKHLNQVAVFTSQSESSTEEELQIIDYGVIANVIQIIEGEDTFKVTLQSTHKVGYSKITNEKDCYYISPKNIEADLDTTPMFLSDLKSKVLEKVGSQNDIYKRIPNTVLSNIARIESLDKMLTALAMNLFSNLDDRKNFMGLINVVEKAAFIESILDAEINLHDVEKSIRERVKKQMEKNQKDYYLNEQAKAIQKELNNGEDIKDEVKEFYSKVDSSNAPESTKEKVRSEIKKFSLMNPVSAEASVVRNYIEWVLSVPWKKVSKSKVDLKKASEYLEEDHYSLDKVKERILEYLAVLKKTNSLKAPIICLVGPPGVGKTSLAKSIAKASGREFSRISLGGVRDESEIRGHRRTYIGAMPGKIIQTMKKVKVSNPLILLDEIDKMGSDFRGDPASALLEVLDPEQNHTFVDHYLEVEYDLSNVMFITTANSYTMQEALLDRMEVIELSGYTEDEKFHIAKNHIIPRQMTAMNLSDEEFKMSDDSILQLIQEYTRESGVRGLTRAVAEVSRKAVKYMIDNDVKEVNVEASNLEEFAGKRKFIGKPKEEKSLVGVTNGLAWTRVGGDTLHIEALKFKGKGNIKITGKIGDVMQESAQAAFSFLKSNGEALGVDTQKLEELDIHIHVPEGATPKDGPSAGVAMITSIYSCLTDMPVRSDIAMTGEITLRGRVLPVGGIKEKVLAALRAGIKDVCIPKENEKDLVEIPKSSLENINVHLISNCKEIIEKALIRN